MGFLVMLDKPGFRADPEVYIFTQIKEFRVESGPYF